MVEFDQFIKRVAKLSKHLQKIGADILIKQEKQIIELSKQQLLEGKNVENRTMQRGYSTQYAKRRKKRGLQTSFVDLRFTGAYQDSKRAIKVKEGINIQSDADYEKYLRVNFPNHVGLTSDNAQIVASVIAEPLAVEIKKFLTQ